MQTQQTDKTWLHVNNGHVPLWLIRRIQRFVRENPHHPRSCKTVHGSLDAREWLKEQYNRARLDHVGSSNARCDTGLVRPFVSEPYPGVGVRERHIELAKLLDMNLRECKESDWGNGTVRYEFYP